ncbi:MAG: ester cyclase [Roseiflexaceae bacterium]|nr:ester cyclase [Roseiflexaceae bacterium]
MTEAHNAVLVRRMVEEIWNRGDLRVADLLFTSDYINHAGLIPDLICGPEAIKISVALYRSAFPELQIAIDELTAKRDAVVLRWTARGSATQGSLTGILVSRIADGQIAESWTEWDRAGVLAGLGIDAQNHKVMEHNVVETISSKGEAQ